jgi:hypothetical protein
MNATERGHGTIVDSLIRANAAVDIKNNDGKTALDLSKRYSILDALQAAIERTVEWRIKNVPDIRLTPLEYAQLTPQQRQLGWVQIQEGNQMAGFKTFYRRRTAQDINDEHNRNIRAQMNNILGRGSQMSRVNNIVPELAIRYERNTYVQLTQSQYNDYKRLESQLRN